MIVSATKYDPSTVEWKSRVTLWRVPSAFGILAKTVRKWIERHRAEASEGLHNRSSRPHRLRAPETNGKAERFIQTALREWAYTRAYQSSEQRLQDLPDWPHRYN